MYDPNGISAMVNALRQPAGVQLAGDTVQLPVIPYSDNVGPTPNSSKFIGAPQQGNVYPISIDLLRAWMDRTTNRPR